MADNEGKENALKEIVIKVEDSDDEAQFGALVRP